MGAVVECMAGKLPWCWDLAAMPVCASRVGMMGWFLDGLGWVGQASKKRTRSEEDGGASGRADKKVMDDVRAAVSRDGTFAPEVVDKVCAAGGWLGAVAGHSAVSAHKFFLRVPGNPQVEPVSTPQIVSRFFNDIGLPAEYFELNNVEAISSHILSLEGGCRPCGTRAASLPTPLLLLGQSFFFFLKLGCWLPRPPHRPSLW